MTAYIENLVSLNLYRTAVDQTTIIAILCDNRERGTILVPTFRIFFILFFRLQKYLLFILLILNFNFVRLLYPEPSFFHGSDPVTQALCAKSMQCFTSFLTAHRILLSPYFYFDKIPMDILNYLFFHRSGPGSQALCAERLPCFNVFPHSSSQLKL